MSVYLKCVLFAGSQVDRTVTSLAAVLARAQTGILSKHRPGITRLNIVQRRNHFPSIVKLKNVNYSNTCIQIILIFVVAFLQVSSLLPRHFNHSPFNASNLARYFEH